MLRIVLALVLLTSLEAGSYAQGQETKAAEKEYNPYLWDFGRVREGEVLKHQFILKNQSRKTLIVTGQNTSCGCTASEVKKKVLAPQEATVVEVQFNSQGYAGPVEQFVYVHTDDLDNPVIRFIIKAEVK